MRSPSGSEDIIDDSDASYISSSATENTENKEWDDFHNTSRTPNHPPIVASRPLEHFLDLRKFDAPTHEDVDQLLAQSLMVLSLEEREHALADVHAVPQPMDESTIGIEEKLAELSKKLSRSQHGSAYEEALAMNAEYCTDRKFRLLFLRAERYNVQEASVRLLRFFELKKTLFGKEKLVKDIQWSDLEEDDKSNLKQGCYQFAPVKDVAGRPIFMNIAKQRAGGIDGTRESFLRAEFYLLMSEIRHSTVELSNWIVYVGWMYESLSYDATSIDFRQAMPIFWVSCHLVDDSDVLLPASRKGIFGSPVNVRARLRHHRGPRSESLDILATFGIPRSAIPVDHNTGDVNLENHLNWCRQAESRDEQPSLAALPGENELPIDSSSRAVTQSPTTAVPLSENVITSDRDILFGRGRRLRNHEGNVRFRIVIDLLMHRYVAASRTLKTSIASSVVVQLKSQNRRFLRRCEEINGWVEVDDAVAREKVAHAFRNRRNLQGYN